jgi:hypothetical protein
MKRILSSSITSTAKQPLIKGSLDFLQDSYKEVINALANGLITYTANDVIKIYGCDVSGSGPYAVTAGAIYYNGEVYLVDAASGLTPGGGQTVVWSIVATFDAIDPVTFSDLSTHSVHKIYKIGLIVGVSGSGIADYNASTVKKHTDAEYDVSCSSGNFELTLTTTGCTGVINFGKYSYIKTGKIVKLCIRVNLAITALGGGNNFYNFKITTPPRAKAKASKANLPGSHYYVKSVLSWGDTLSTDSSGDINTNFDNSYVATISTYTHFIEVTYEVA